MKQLLRKTAKHVAFEGQLARRKPFKGPCAGVFRPNPNVEATMFQTRYRRGELPCAIEHGGASNSRGPARSEVASARAQGVP